MATQSLTLEDPEVFKGLKEEDPLFYNREISKIPKEKAALLLSSILKEQLSFKDGGAISLNPDTLLSGYLVENSEDYQNRTLDNATIGEEREQ